MALTVVFWPIGINPEQTGEFAVGVVQSSVQWTTAPGVVSLMVTDCPVEYVPAAGENIGVAAVVCASAGGTEYAKDRRAVRMQTGNSRDVILGMGTLLNTRGAHCRYFSGAEATMSLEDEPHAVNVIVPGNIDYANNKCLLIEHPGFPVRTETPYMLS
jgi:hypothetical protein